MSEVKEFGEGAECTVNPSRDNATGKRKIDDELKKNTAKIVG